MRISVIFLHISLTLGLILMQKNIDSQDTHDLEYVRLDTHLGI